jgi:hypothetical protein
MYVLSSVIATVAHGRPTVTAMKNDRCTEAMVTTMSRDRIRSVTWPMPGCCEAK